MLINIIYKVSISVNTVVINPELIAHSVFPEGLGTMIGGGYKRSYSGTNDVKGKRTSRYPATTVVV